MSAKVIDFVRRKRRVPDTGPMDVDYKKYTVDTLLETAIKVESGEYAEVAISVVTSDGGMFNAFTTPSNLRGLLKSLRLTHRDLIEFVAENGTRDS